MSNHNFKNLMAAIMPLSHATDWDVAKREWRLEDIEFAEEPATCPCTHFPIIELCIIHNSVTDNRLVVGNHCVKQFIGLPSDTIFGAVRRIRKDITKSIGEKAAEFFNELKVINEWEYKFLLNTTNKRKMSSSQAVKRVQINTKILARLLRVAIISP